MTPSTNQPFPNNQIPANRIDPNASILLEQYYSLPNRAGAPNYAVTPSSATDWREELIRWDHHFTDRFKLTARYVQDTWEQEQAIKKPAPHAFATLGNFFGKPGRNLTAKLSNILGRAALNEFTYGFSMNRITNTPNPEATRPSALRIPEIFPLNRQNVIPDVAITGYGGIGTGNQLNNVNPVFTFRDDYSILVGRHSFKLGAEVIRTQKFSTSYNNMQGSFSFNGSRSGNAFADFLLGEAFNYTENEIEEKGYFFATDYEFYAQDDWKAGRDLTINYGLRYYVMEGGNGGAEKYDRISTFVPGLYDPAQAPRLTAAGDLVAGTGDPMNGLITPTNLKGLDLPRSLKKTHFDVFGPRLGFAYSLPGGRATVLRGGYGLFYFWGENNNEGRQTNPPFGRSANIFTTRLSNPGAGTDRIFPPNVAAVDVENLPPTIMHWSLGVQRELGAGLLAEVTYVGTRSYHLSRVLNINQPRVEVARSSGGANINTIRPYLGYGNLNYSENSAESKYHALEAHVLRRFSGGMLFQVAYTFSKGLADEGVQDIYDKRSAWGLFSLDRTHMLTLNYVYELPWLKTRTDALGPRVRRLAAERDHDLPERPAAYRDGPGRSHRHRRRLAPEPGERPEPGRASPDRQVVQHRGVRAAAGGLLRKCRQQHYPRPRHRQLGPERLQKHPAVRELAASVRRRVLQYLQPPAVRRGRECARDSNVRLSDLGARPAHDPVPGQGQLLRAGEKMGSDDAPSGIGHCASTAASCRLGWTKLASPA